jgi:hypothetical protein
LLARTLTEPPAHAEFFVDYADAARSQIYLVAPELTLEECQALARASRRDVLVNLVLRRAAQWPCDLKQTNVTLYELNIVPWAFASFDIAYAGTGGDLEALDWKYDRDLSALLMSMFWMLALQAPDR